MFTFAAGFKKENSLTAMQHHHLRTPTRCANSSDCPVYRRHNSRSPLFGELGWYAFGAGTMIPAGSGQKLCVVLTFTTPSSTAFKIPGTSVIRIPWLNSTYSNPRSPSPSTSRNRLVPARAPAGRQR